MKALQTLGRITALGFAAVGCQSALAGCDFSPGRFQQKGSEVVDSKTGITWQRCAVGQHWNQKLSRCEGQGKQPNWVNAQRLATKPWRLPTANELKGLIQPGCESPAVDPKAFPITDDYLASWSSELTVNQTNAIAVSLSGGRYYEISKNEADTTRYAHFHVHLIKTTK